MPALLDGLKVVDIGWIKAGPFGARYLADLGATTYKVETAKRMDPLRGMGPFKDGVAGPERSISYHQINAGKLGLAVDVKTPEGRDLVRRLVGVSDVFIESFTPGVIDNLGLSYAELSAINPRLIMISSGILGRKGLTGLGLSGTGTTGSAYAGATYLVGWPDRPPSGPNGPWTDDVAPRYLAVSVLAALHRRARTGQGAYIDLSQAEAGLQFLTPAYFAYAVDGVRMAPGGSAGEAHKSPCGAYPCRGNDRWVVIDADRPKAWDALRAELAPLLDDPAFSTLVGRLRGRDALDGHIAAWTRDRDAKAVEAQLQAAGVPAHVLCDSEDLATDPDLEASGFYREVEDSVMGALWLTGPPWTPSISTLPPTRPGPRIGDSSFEILSKELGLSLGEIDALKAKAVLK